MQGQPHFGSEQEQHLGMEQEQQHLGMEQEQHSGVEQEPQQLGVLREQPLQQQHIHDMLKQLFPLQKASVKMQFLYLQLT